MSRSFLERTGESASTVIKFLSLAVIVLGLAAAAFWYSHHGAVKPPEAAENGGLSKGTLAILNQLDSPVEIHFYSLLDKASVPAGTFAFADRVGDLLAEYQQAGNGKVVIQRFQALSDANAAAADGVKAFNLDKGNACFLGLTLSCGGQKDSFPRLSEDWEPALEADLSRSIARLSAPRPNPATAMPAGPAAPSAAAIEDLKGALTNLADITVADGSRILSAAALAEFQKTALEMEPLVKDARQKLAEAQNGGNESDLQAAMKNLQQIEAEQSEKLKQITARLQSRITTLEQIKKP